jgi:hypothetical protein
MFGGDRVSDHMQRVDKVTPVSRIHGRGNQGCRKAGVALLPYSHERMEIIAAVRARTYDMTADRWSRCDSAAIQ